MGRQLVLIHGRSQQNKNAVALKAEWLDALDETGRMFVSDRENDQVQLYRPLTVDPKEARRQRYRGKRAGAASGSPTR